MGLATRLFVNFVLLVASAAYAGLGAFLFHKLGIKDTAESNYWEALSYTLSVLTTNGEGYLYCDSSKCKAVTIYYGMVGVFLVWSTIALTAYNVGSAWVALFEAVCSETMEVGSRKAVSVLFGGVVWFAWFLLVTILPATVLYFKHKDTKSYQDLPWLHYHYTCMMTALTVGFGDILLVPHDHIEQQSVVYGCEAVGLILLGSIPAFFLQAWRRF